MEASNGYDDKIFGDVDIPDFVMRSEFRFERESVFDLFYGLIAFQRVASYDKYLIIPFPMPSRLHIIPHLIKQEEHKETRECA